MCDAFSRENVSINTLCDGIHDCADGNDETNILCESEYVQNVHYFERI